MKPVEESYCTRCQHLQVCKHVEKMDITRKKIESLIEITEPIEINITCKFKINIKR